MNQDLIQAAQAAKLLDETNLKGALRPLNDEIRKWLRTGKQKLCS